MLATVLVARLVGPKEDVLRRLHVYIAKEIDWFRGREIDIAENRLLAIFDGPARAIRCASAITEYASRLAVETSTGFTPASVR